MKIIQVPMWCADDGTQFDNQLDCAMHEAKARIASTVHDFVDDICEDKGERRRTEVRNIVELWETFKISRESQFALPLAAGETLVVPLEDPPQYYPPIMNTAITEEELPDLPQSEPKPTSAPPRKKRAAKKA